MASRRTPKARKARPDRETVNTRLDVIYARLPAMECRGQCWDSCGSIGMTRPEQQLVEQRHGVKLPIAAAFTGAQARCPALTMLGRCGVYDSRPLICRLWGLVPSMRCNWGCLPEGGLLSDAEGYLLMADVFELAGDHRGAANLRAMWGTPESAAKASAYLRASERARLEAFEVRRNLAERNGSARYMTAGGALVRERTPQAD
jgi:Fe-S-cluster containining protein